MKLWKYNRITGMWTFMRTCEDKAWLAVFQKDEPDQHFKLSKTRPRLPPKEKH